MSARSGGFIAIQGTANAKTWPVEDMIRARSREPGAAGGEYDQDARNGTQGRLPPVVERALSWYAGHGGDGSGIARRREGFGSEGRGQRSEVRNQRRNIER
jgi:hypothetical protein